MANTPTLAASFAYFDQLPAELQVNIIRLAWEDVLANRTTTIASLIFHPRKINVGSSVSALLAGVNRLFRSEILRLSRPKCVPVFPHRQNKLLYFDANTDILGLDFEQTPSPDCMKRLKRLSEDLTKSVKHLKLRLYHDVYYQLARLRPHAQRFRTFWRNMLRRFPRLTSIEVVGVRCRPRSIVEALFDGLIAAQRTTVTYRAYRGEERLKIEWLGCSSITALPQQLSPSPGRTSNGTPPLHSPFSA
jgi:hypothetical protein